MKKILLGVAIGVALSFVAYTVFGLNLCGGTYGARLVSGQQSAA
jgi:hypothetical protein